MKRLTIKVLVPTILICIKINAQIFINQTGYKNDLQKIFYTNISATNFEVVESETGNTFYNGNLQLISSNDPATGMAIRKGDFTSLNRNGNYFIRLNSSDTSYHFTIGENVIEDLYLKSLKSFYFQRCGTQLLYTHAGQYQRNICHTGDAFFHSSTGQSGFKYSRGGWHDAGDYGKYIVNAGISAATLLMAYEYFPSYFSYDNLNIPESGNGIPDILDEVKYEVQWFLTMQDTSGAVFFKLTKEQFEPFVMPSQDSGMRYIYEKSSAATADFIAVLARFYRVYKNYDSTFANTCLTSAINAWNWLSNQLTIVPAGGFHNPPGTYTGEYGDNNDSDERLWAAAELFEATGDQSFKEYYEFNYNASGLFNSTMNWQNVKSLAHITYLYSNRQNSDPIIKTQLAASLDSYCNSLLTKVNANGFGVTLNPGDYYWGSNSQVLNNGVLLLLSYSKNNNINFLNAALEQLNYVTGSNAHNLSFITGTGKKSPLHPHHRPSEADGISEPIPGLIVGGPNQYLNDPVLQQHFNQNTPPALCYIDDVGSYASNEIAINWNAPLVFVSGYFSNLLINSVEGEKQFSPQGFYLEQNFPNPFNSATRINWYSQQNGWQKIKLYDSLGRELQTIAEGFYNAGFHSLLFSMDSSIPSGVYYYQLRTDNSVLSKKMIYLK
ncbi:Cellodextrinase [Ignavibacterium album JCM 16511]|uniref:Endoglucanase n=1 Tax=Ignavibacterium album (strain DSM 19864 / JCM 16511 / NBRC 101810 / Mat9-16) TaxID=945713 RepID=I0AMU2_IGNAJ|nr:glycoside hydrolase family 9 protein [Ignavibacterium album]AFH50299.1 Cellodextrinase [Ignavibacterium album JCM 16511]